MIFWRGRWRKNGDSKEQRLGYLFIWNTLTCSLFLCLGHHTLMIISLSFLCVCISLFTFDFCVVILFLKSMSISPPTF
jgi:hypothetical protein